MMGTVKHIMSEGPGTGRQTNLGKPDNAVRKT